MLRFSKNIATLNPLRLRQKTLNFGSANPLQLRLLITSAKNIINLVYLIFNRRKVDHYKLVTDRYHFLIPIFSKKFFTDIWPVVDILLTTDTDIPKFPYRYFNKVFWLKLVEIA